MHLLANVWRFLLKLTISSLLSFSTSAAAMLVLSPPPPCGAAAALLPLLSSSSCIVSSSTFATARDNSFSFSLKSARIESKSDAETRKMDKHKTPALSTFWAHSIKFRMPQRSIFSILSDSQAFFFLSVDLA